MKFADYILDASAQFHGVTVDRVRSAAREAPLPAARRFFAYLCDKEIKLRKTEIGRAICRDHSSICASIDAVKNTMNPSLQMQIDMVREVAINRMSFDAIQAASRHKTDTKEKQ